MRAAFLARARAVASPLPAGSMNRKLYVSVMYTDTVDLPAAHAIVLAQLMRGDSAGARRLAALAAGVR